MPLLTTTIITNPVFTKKVLKILVENKIFTTLEFLHEDLEKLGNVTKLCLPDIIAIRREIFEKYSAPVINVKHIFTTKHKRFLDTGIKKFNELLGGGLSLECITEFCGLTGSGKTQLCLHLSVICSQINECQVLYIDTKGDFSAIRIQEVLENNGCSHKDVASIMNRIKIIRVWNMEELVQLFDEMKQNMIVIEKLSLIIIDSLPCLMFQHIGENCKVGLSSLNAFVNLARFLCDKLSLSIICVNIITRWVEQDFSEIEETNARSTDATWKETKSRCLGRYWQHIPAFVVMLESCTTTQDTGCDNLNINVVLTKSINQRCNLKCNLTINNLGLN